MGEIFSQVQGLDCVKTIDISAEMILDRLYAYDSSTNFVLTLSEVEVSNLEQIRIQIFGFRAKLCCGRFFRV